MATITSVSRIAMMKSRRGHSLINKTLPFIAFIVMSLVGCSTLGTFNAIAPKDGGSYLESSGLVYGSDPRQKLDIYRPREASGPVPVIVFVYGGSWNSGDRGAYGFVGRALADRGYVTIVIDYRLVPNVRYPTFVEDTAKAVAWTYRNVAAHGGDPEQLYLVGHSAGAYNAMMVALAPRYLGAEGLKPSIVKAAVGISGPYDFLPLDVDETREAFKGVPDLAATQPVNLPIKGRYAPPILLLHGSADTLVYPRNSEALAAALRKTGHVVENRFYPGIDHVSTLLAISRPMRKRAPVVDDVVGFLKQH